MLESLVGVLAIGGLIVMLARLYTRVGLLERELGALRSFVLSLPAGAAVPADRPVVAPGTVPPEAVAPETAAAEAADAAAARETVPEVPALAADMPAEEQAVAMEAAAQTADAAVADAPPVPPAARRRDIETALGTRWAVWVGGIALALGGVFLVRYSIEAGIFGPGMRLTMAGLLGIALVAGGEFIRRTGFKVPVEGAAGAYIPAILTAAGAFTLFGTVYAAHALYGFIGPAAAFVLLGLIGVATIAAALVHGQALAGIGLLGSFATPVLVSSDSPNAWALFGYLAVVLLANTAIARLRDWIFLAAAGFVGTGLWCLGYMTGAPSVDLIVVLFINAVMLLALALVWLGGWPARPDTAPVRMLDWVSAAPGAAVAIASLGLLVDEVFVAAGGQPYGALLVAAMLAIALVRPAALPLLFAAGAAAVLAHLRHAAVGTYGFEISGEPVIVDGLPLAPVAPTTVPLGAALALLFLGAGLWNARRLAAALPLRAAFWSAWAALVPLVVVGSLWLALGNVDRDLAYALTALVLTAALVAGGEFIARAEQPPLTGRWAVTAALVGAGLAAVLALHMGFGGLWTTILLGAASVVPALATRPRAYPVLGWLCVGAVVAVMGRVAFDPSIVGADLLGRTPVLNALLPGYGVPALAFLFCAWQLARTTDGRPRLVMEAAAALFSLLTVAMLVRHAMNGGVINDAVPTLAEQAIYTLLALGAGAILVAIDQRSPSPVLRIGSLAAGVVSVGLVVLQHFLVLNPLFTDESTGKIPFFNLLFLAYLLPALAAGALALYARGKRPKWYSAMLGLLAATLAFAYATLSVRRLFQGEFIGLWAGMTQLETYSYSALWLALGVVVLVIGVRLGSQVLRIASAVLIAVAVAKVFIFDMSELEGVLRALSFIGLGVVLIGIGLFYQRLLTRHAAPADTAKPA